MVHQPIMEEIAKALVKHKPVDAGLQTLHIYRDAILHFPSLRRL
jgi:hypothetical protein